MLKKERDGQLVCNNTEGDAQQPHGRSELVENARKIHPPAAVQPKIPSIVAVPDFKLAI